ncbi:hypothetical protein C8T65DRAFT_648761, partial [Cerioporus squamosus]
MVPRGLGNAVQDAPCERSRCVAVRSPEALRSAGLFNVQSENDRSQITHNSEIAEGGAK